jgi:hypothetical protein
VGLPTCLRCLNYEVDYPEVYSRLPVSGHSLLPFRVESVNTSIDPLAAAPNRSMRIEAMTKAMEAGLPIEPPSSAAAMRLISTVGRSTSVARLATWLKRALAAMARSPTDQVARSAFDCRTR